MTWRESNKLYAVAAIDGVAERKTFSVAKCGSQLAAYQAAIAYLAQQEDMMDERDGITAASRALLENGTSLAAIQSHLRNTGAEHTGRHCRICCCTILTPRLQLDSLSPPPTLC